MKRARIIKIERRLGRTYLTFRSEGEKNQLEIQGNVADFRRFIFDRISEDMDFAVFLALANWMRRNPGVTDFSAIEGKTITLDLDAEPTTGILVIE